jgi:MFS family permease
VNWRCFSYGLGIGAEWGVRTSLLQEVWPEKWRTKGAGLLQSGFSIGGVLISSHPAMSRVMDALSEKASR